MRSSGIVLTVVGLLVGGCASARPPTSVTLVHPSSGTLPPNEVVHPMAMVAFSLSEVTDQQVCVDHADYAWGDVKQGPQAAIDAMERKLARVSATPLMFVARDGSRVPVPVTTRFAPRYVGVSDGKVTMVRFVKTGEKQQVCVEDVMDERNIAVGCKRWEDQDTIAKEEYAKAYKYHEARGGLRWCAANTGNRFIAPTSGQFDIIASLSLEANERYDRLRFTFTGGSAHDRAWGARGGTSAEGDAFFAKHDQYNRTTPPTGAATPSGTTPPEGATTKTTHPPVSKPVASGLREKATGRFEIVAFTLALERGHKMEVRADGSMWSDGKEVGRFSRDGVLTGPDGKDVIALSSANEVWAGRTPAVLYRIQGRTLVAAGNGATISIAANGAIEMRQPNKPPRTSKQRLVLPKGASLAVPLLVIVMQLGGIPWQ
jgi:hypothetical protein